MPRYRLFAKFQVNEGGGAGKTELYDETVDCDDQQAAKDCLDTQISKMITSYSNQAQDWTLIEMNVTLIQDEDIPKTNGSLNSIQLL